MPPWEFVFGPALIGMSDYWTFDFWAPRPAAGGAQTYLGALLAIVYHSALTLWRLSLGLVIGTTLGVGLAWSTVIGAEYIRPRVRHRAESSSSPSTSATPGE